MDHGVEPMQLAKTVYWHPLANEWRSKSNKNYKFFINEWKTE